MKKPQVGWYIVNASKGSLNFWYVVNGFTGKDYPVRNTYEEALNDIPKNQRTEFLEK